MAIGAGGGGGALSGRRGGGHVGRRGCFTLGFFGTIGLTDAVFVSARQLSSLGGSGGETASSFESLSFSSSI